MRILILDPGSVTGWALFNNNRYEKSGVINTGACTGNKVAFLRARLMDMLFKEDKIDLAYIEKKGEYPLIVKLKKNGKTFKKSLSKQLQMYSAYWEIVKMTIEEIDIPIEILDTRRLAKKKIAQMKAKAITGRKSISTHKAEAVCWGEYLCRAKPSDLKCNSVETINVDEKNKTITVARVVEVKKRK